MVVKMKRFLIGVISFCILLLTAGTTMAEPWQIMHGEETIEKGQVVATDLLFSGDRLEVNGEIKGDLIVWSGQVVVNGKIDGSILGVAWDKLVINGEVLNNIRVCANEIRINGKVNGVITTAAANFNTGVPSLIGQGLLGVFSKVDLQGTINGPVDVKSVPLIPNNGRFSGRINGNVKIQGSAITWQAPLTINGTVNDYTGVANDPAKIKGISFTGRYLLHQPLENHAENSGMMTFFSIVWFIGSLLASIILYSLFPRTLWMMTEPSRPKFRRSMLIGLLGLIGLPIIILILTITIVGIPLAILAGLVYLILLLFSGVPVYLWFGRLIFRSRFHPSLMIVLGGLLLMFLSFIPIVNGAIFLLFLLLGIGMSIGNIKLQIYERDKLDIKM
jgi:Cation transport ATPase